MWHFGGANLYSCNGSSTWWGGDDRATNGSKVCTSSGEEEFFKYTPGKIERIAGDWTQAGASGTALGLPSTGTAPASGSTGSASTCPGCQGKVSTATTVGVGVGVGVPLTLLSLILEVLLLRERKKRKGLMVEGPQGSSGLTGTPYQQEVTGQTPKQYPSLHEMNVETRSAELVGSER